MPSIETVRKISPKVLLKIIDKAKKYLKTNDVYLKMCKDFDIDPDTIDVIPMKFGDIDVSARTEKGIITFNYKLLCDGDFIKDYMYALHEIAHTYQQCYGDKPSIGANEGDYLSNPYEEEGFQYQLKYIENEQGPEQAEKYVDHLLEHHEVSDPKERKEKKEILLEKTDV
jgi:hypothetical protein